MTLLRRNRAMSLACLLVAVSFGFALVQACSIHTDDGCAVELHCFACYWAYAVTGVVATGITHEPALERTGAVAVREVPLPADVPSPAPASRGPPFTA
jgi:hypothetical protein